MLRTVAPSGATARRSSIGLGTVVAIFTHASTSAEDVFERLSCISIIAPELYVAGGSFAMSFAVNSPFTAFTAISRNSAVV